MDFSKLFKMQRELDSYIETKRGLESESLLDRKLLAFHVELAELANETRCFKFWSEKGPSEYVVILEEYVDGLHFILSIGIEYGFSDQTNIVIPKVEKQSGEALVPYFSEVMNAATTLQMGGERFQYQRLFQDYLILGAALGFSYDQIINAYVEKNNVNYDRQNKGY